MLGAVAVMLKGEASVKKKVVEYVLREFATPG